MPADAAPPPEAYALFCACPALVALLLGAGAVSLGFWLARRRRTKQNGTAEQTE